MRFSSLIRSRCSELVSMLCAVLSCSRAMWLAAYSCSRSRKRAFSSSSFCASRTWPSRNTLMPRRRLASRRSCRWQISAMPASEKLRALRIFLSSTSCSTRSMMSPICSMLMVKRDDVGPAPALAFGQRLARDLRQVELDRRCTARRPCRPSARSCSASSQVVVADHRQHAAQHGLHHVGLVQRLARGAADGQRRRGQRHRVEVARAVAGAGCGGGRAASARPGAPPGR